MLASKVRDKLDRLNQFVSGLDSVIVAYSGGVDSSLVSSVAHEMLGRSRALIVTANSPSMAPYELEAASRLAEERRWNHIIIETDEMSDRRYTQNDGARCFFCKTELYTRLSEMAQANGFDTVVNGANADDLGDYRPGMRAASDFRVLSPLVEIGITKEEVRLIAKSLGLPNWDKPAQPCLSSRIPYGTHVTVEALGMIAKAERHLRALGFTQCRVRHYGATAVVELPKSKMDDFLDPSVRVEAEQGIKAAGYEAVELNPSGFRSGSLNDALKRSIESTT